MEEVSLQTHPAEPIKPPLKSVRIHLLVTCSRCNTQTGINSITPEITCATCRQKISIKDNDWKTLFEDVLKTCKRVQSDYEGSTMVQYPGHRLILGYSKKAIQCTSCFADIPFSTETEGVTALTCPSCQSEMSLRKATAEIKKVARDIEWLVGNDVDSRTEQSSYYPPASTSVAQCPSCGASLPVDGKSRVVNCEFCLSTVTLSDETWQRLYPTATNNVWYILYRGTPPRKDYSLTPAQKEKVHRDWKKQENQKNINQPQAATNTRGAFRTWLLEEGGFVLPLMTGVIAFSLVRGLAESGMTISDYFSRTDSELTPMGGVITMVIMTVISIIHYISVRKKWMKDQSGK